MRFLLIGIYGWLWLALASWALSRVLFRASGPVGSFLRLTGHAHLPLLVTALIVVIVTVTFGVATVGWWPAAFAVLLWMPSMLAAAVATASDLDLRRALPVAIIPHVFWVAIVGRHLWTQLAHLL